MNSVIDVENIALSPEISKLRVSKWKEKSLYLLGNLSSGEKHSETSSVLLKKKEILENKLHSQLDEIKKIKKEIQDLESNKDTDVIKYKLGLYQLITNITWDVNSLPTDVIGYVSKPFNTFTLSTETHSSYDITNYLWKLIGGEVEALAASP